MTEFVLTRFEFGDRHTISDLTLANRHICWTLEDKVREVPGQPVESWKIKGQTAIPYGRYKIVRTFSTRFQRVLPLLLNVPGFTGIRFHAGNTHADTDGCPLPGLYRRSNGTLGSSALALIEIERWLQALEDKKLEAWVNIIKGEAKSSGNTGILV